MPTTKESSAPGIRTVYSADNMPDKIPLPGGNPYDDIYLLSNNHGKKGYSYGETLVSSKTITNNLQATISYCFEKSIALFDPVGTGNTIDGQWEGLETVNGKNFAERSISDFDLGHRISAEITQKFNYGKWSSMVTLIYNGQSGAPFSYVYAGSIINDAGALPQFNAESHLYPHKNRS